MGKTTLILLVALAASGVASLPVHAAKYLRQTEAVIQAANAWSRATTAEARVAVVYMTLENNTDTSDGLMAASTPIARRVELHETTEKNGLMAMNQVNEIPIPRNGSTEIKPGGYHLMLIDLQRPLDIGTEFPMTLTFVNTPSLNVRVKVMAPSYTGEGKEIPHPGR